MAITSAGNFISAGNTRVGTYSSDITTAQAANVGDLIVLSFGCDASITPCYLGVSDPSGLNVWNQAAVYNARGYCLSIYFSRLRAAISKSAKITVSINTGASGSRAIGTGWRYRVSTDVVAITPAKTADTNSGSAISVSLPTSGSWNSAEHLVYRNEVYTNATASSWTVTSNYTQLSPFDYTAGGYFVDGEWRIQTATSHTSAPSATTSGLERVTLFCGFMESIGFTHGASMWTF